MDRTQTLAEYVADGAVHLIGLAFGMAATFTLASIVWNSPDIARQTSVMIYAACLMTMLVCSASYNMLARDYKTSILRRLDHAAIFLMIGGTYTPLAAMVIGGWTGSILLAVVWTGALVGAGLKLLASKELDRITVPICLGLGWIVVFAIQPLAANATDFGFWMIVSGGLLYTVGTVFYAWKKLPFQNAIWHVFVLGAALCHFAAVLNDVALFQVA